MDRDFPNIHFEYSVYDAIANHDIAKYFHNAQIPTSEQCEQCEQCSNCSPELFKLPGVPVAVHFNNGSHDTLQVLIGTIEKRTRVRPELIITPLGINVPIYGRAHCEYTIYEHNGTCNLCTFDNNQYTISQISNVCVCAIPQK